MLIKVTLKACLWQGTLGLWPSPSQQFYQLLELKKKSESMLTEFVGETKLRQ